MLIPALFTLLRVRLTLWLLPWPRAERALARPVLFFNSSILQFFNSPTCPDRDRQAALARAVLAASRFVPGSTCFVQAIALKMLLAREGKASVVRLGISAISAPPCDPAASAPPRAAGSAPPRAATSPCSASPREPLLDAHAWLECDGVILLGDPRGLYEALSASAGREVCAGIKVCVPRLRVKMPQR